MSTNEALLNRLNEAKRDALVPYYLQHVVPNALKSKIKTSEDLYEYLLLDPQVSAKVKTSRLAEAVASVQLYLHRCREQLEPDVVPGKMAEASKDGGLFFRWDAYNKRYATWAGLQRLVRYPASYLDPELRYAKTDLFRELEDTLNQGRITEERVEQAFTQYVSALRSLLQLRVVSGYLVEPLVNDVTADKYDNGPAYFCAASREAPNEFYWRRVVSVDWVDRSNKKYTSPLGNPVSWSQWQKVDAPIEPAPGTVPAIVYFDHRVHVLCLHQRPTGVEGKPMRVSAFRATAESEWAEAEPTFVWELQFATLSPSGHWRVRSWSLKDLLPQLDHPVRVFACELRPEDEAQGKLRTLGVFFKAAGESDEQDPPHLCRFNHLFERLDAPNWMFDFRHHDGTGSGVGSLLVFQPLKIHAQAEAPTVTISREFTIELPDPTAPSARLFAIESNGGNQTKLAATIMNNFTASLEFFVRYKEGGQEVAVSDRVTVAPKTEKPCVFTANIAYRVIAENSAYGAELCLMLPGFPGSSVVGPIRLERRPGQYKVTYFNNNNLSFIRTAPDAQGASQELGFVPTSWGDHPVLTTLAGAMLERQLLAGVDHLLNWTVQTEFIDPRWNMSNLSLDLPFHGGVGVYTWELFFHAPFLVASRLLTEQRFAEAEAWFRRIFSPAGYRNAEGELQMVGSGANRTPRYWNVRPLQERTAWSSSASIGADDPDLTAAADPMHYKLAVYLRWLDLLMARGDQAYRQQTRDSLTEAKMWYVQVLQLLGPRPELPLALNWSEPTLGEAIERSSPLLLWLEQLVDAAPGTMPPPLAPGLLDQVALANSLFLPPVNDAVLAYWDRAEQRLSNLRRHLSINGQPLALPLFEPPVSPRDLQLARQAGDAAGGGPGEGTVQLWSQRFPLLLERARQAVQQVMQLGSTLQGILERRDTDALSVLQQTQQGGLLALAQGIQGDNQRALEHALEGLRRTRTATEARRRHYDALYQEHVSRREQEALTRFGEAVDYRKVAAGAQVLAGVLDAIPISYTAGMAFGVGFPPFGAVPRALGGVAELVALDKESDARKLETSEQYRRRRDDWQLQRDQAEHELSQLDAQIDATQAQIDMARQQVAQVEQEQAYSQAVLDVLTTRFNGQTLFNWMAGRLATLYYQIYDAALGLCAQAQRSYAWETGDRKPYLRPGQWNDVYQGLLAGEGLLLSLQQLENAYLAWDRRGLEVRKTISLDALSEGTLSKDVRDVLEAKTIAADERSGHVTVELEGDEMAVSFDLTHVGIKADYPDSLGDKRLIKNISVTLPVLLGPYQDIQAVLRYEENTEVPDGCKAIAISHGINDSGQFQLDFNDSKYLPFEGLPIETGKFSLLFPRATGEQKTMLLSLTDIIMHVNYTIHA